MKVISWNIISGRRARLEMALRAMMEMNVDLGFLFEAKLTDNVYTRNAYGYSVVATEAVSHVQGSFALFYRCIVLP